MESEIAKDIKITLASIGDIANSNDEQVKESCLYVLNALKKELVKCAPPTEFKYEITPLIGLFRTRIILSLMRDANAYGTNDPEYERHFAFIQGIVEQKINILKDERKEENEKNIRG